MALGSAWLGLLSRMADRLRRRRPFPDDAADAPAADAAVSARALKEAVERRRRNEAVRQREFDHLRQLRNRGIGVSAPSGGSQLSLFETTLAGQPEERAQTLRKIDRVEAQMARLRWPAAAAEVGGAGAVSDVTLPPAEDGALDAAGFAPTAMALGGAGESAALRAGGQPGIAAPATQPAAPTPESDPPLEEAALRWALGDAAGATAVLQAALQGAKVHDGRHGAWRAALDEIQGGLAGGGATVPPVSEAGAAIPALAGQLSGDIDAPLAALGAGSAPCLAVACTQLRRVDFAAAGCLLGWAQAHEARGCQVQFRDVSPLVAAFLRSVGLAEYAQIVQRAL